MKFSTTNLPSIKIHLNNSKVLKEFTFTTWIWTFIITAKGLSTREEYAEYDDGII